MVRAFERMFRRVGISLAMSQGFHPRPLMTFPDALSLGIAAENEVMDIVLSEPIDPEDFRDRLAASCPPGLVIHNVRELGEQERKAKIEKVVYEMDVPDQLQSDTHDLQQAINTLQKTETLSVTRKGKQIEIDLKETLDGLWTSV
jgi:radical SAM-linked protein